MSICKYELWQLRLQVILPNSLVYHRENRIKPKSYKFSVARKQIFTTKRYVFTWNDIKLNFIQNLCSNTMIRHTAAHNDSQLSCKNTHFECSDRCWALWILISLGPCISFFFSLFNVYGLNPILVKKNTYQAFGPFSVWFSVIQTKIM